MFFKKKILFIAPEFYSYHSEIIDAFNRLGAEVFFHSEMNQSLLYKISNKLSSFFKRYLENKHFKKLLNIPNAFDYVFVIRGAYFSVSRLESLKLKFQESKFILYQWDSYEQNDFREIIPYFDSVITFDRADSLELSIDYIPLFFTPAYSNTDAASETKCFDLVFVGAYHSDRLELVKLLDLFFRNNKLVFLSHLYISKLALIYRVLKGEIRLSDVRFFKTYKIPISKIVSYYNNSKSVLDVELTIQTGLSVRTFEVLASGSKLITTNPNIMCEPFFEQKNILVIDRGNVQIPLDFFVSSSDIVDFDEYSVDNWLRKIFSLSVIN